MPLDLRLILAIRCWCSTLVIQLDEVVVAAICCQILKWRKERDGLSFASSKITLQEQLLCTYLHRHLSVQKLRVEYEVAGVVSAVIKEYISNANLVMIIEKKLNVGQLGAGCAFVLSFLFVAILKDKFLQPCCSWNLTSLSMYASGFTYFP